MLCRYLRELEYAGVAAVRVVPSIILPNVDAAVDQLDRALARAYLVDIDPLVAGSLIVVADEL